MGGTISAARNVGNSSADTMGGTVNRPKKRQLNLASLFEDPDFPADSSVLFRGGHRFGIEWKRPWEISENPVFIDNDMAYNDIDQGDLGNCWFLSSVACIAVSSHKELLSRVIPKNQGFGSEYTGKFKFSFWRYGNWVDVVIDDRLPTRDGELIYSKNVDQPDEYWVPLLEKAFAKIYGNYNVLDGGRIHTALVDLTGGLGEMVPLKEQIADEDLTDLLLRCQKMDSFMGGSVFAKPFGGREAVAASGLVEGHAYTVVKVKKVKTSKGEFVLLHIRNPHGKGEWRGAWSDKSAEWNTLSGEDKKETFKTENDGEFWISVSDFRKHFDELELCHLDPELLSEGYTEKRAEFEWETFEYRGKWERQFSAGGPPISFLSKKFWANPQMELHIPSSSQKSTVVISLFEIDDLVNRLDTDISIGFAVFQMPEGKKLQRITEENYYDIEPRMVQSSGVSWPYRERTRRFLLDSGDYIIVPYTSRAGQEAEYYMRIFAEHRGTSSVTTTEIMEPPAPAKPDPVLSSHLDALNKAFDALSGSEGAIEAKELVEVLNAGTKAAEGKPINFSVDTCRSLISLITTNSPKGLINRDGLHRLWTELGTWQEAFRIIDTDKNMSVDSNELKNLFDIIELTTSPVIVGALMKRYGGKNGRVSENDFIQGVCKALQLQSKYLELKRNGKIEIDLSEWMTFGLSV